MDKLKTQVCNSVLIQLRVARFHHKSHLINHQAMFDCISPPALLTSGFDECKLEVVFIESSWQ